jgi:hypothetical protein
VSAPRVFVSYVQENRPVVVKLVHELRNASINVWFDQDALPPGVFWRDEIMAAVRRHDYFIACFSVEYAARNRTFMNEELELAIDEVRRRSESPWFIPVLLSGEIPDRQISAARSLRDIQYVDLVSSNWSAAIASLISILRPNPHSSIPADGRNPGHRSDRLTEPTNSRFHDTSLAERPAPNIQLVQLHVCSAELVVGQAIREVNGNARHAVPAYVAFFRNDPTGQPLGIPANVGAKIWFVADGFTITAMGLWIDEGDRTSFPVGVTRRLWLVAMPPNSAPLTVEPSGAQNARLHHQMLRNIEYRCELLLFDATGVQITRVSAPLELPF